MSKNPWLTKPTNRQLRCLAFGHSWDRPQDWHQWTAGKRDDGTYRIETERWCRHDCYALQITTMVVRVSLRGNIVEVLRTRHRVRWPSMAKLRRELPKDQRPRRRDEYRLELISRQLSAAIKKTGTKMRRSDASANISVMLSRQS